MRDAASLPATASSPADEPPVGLRVAFSLVGEIVDHVRFLAANPACDSKLAIAYRSLLTWIGVRHRALETAAKLSSLGTEDGDAEASRYAAPGSQRAKERADAGLALYAAAHDYATSSTKSEREGGTSTQRLYAAALAFHKVDLFTPSEVGELLAAAGSPADTGGGALGVLAGLKFAPPAAAVDAVTALAPTLADQAHEEDR
jgi:hypothetical protein